MNMTICRQGNQVKILSDVVAVKEYSIPKPGYLLPDGMELPYKAVHSGLITDSS